MPAMEDVRAGRRPFVKLDVLHRENLEKVLVKHGIPGKNAIGGLSEEQIDWLNRCWHRLDPWQDSVEGLKRLKAKFIIAPQSNGNIALITNMAKRAGLPGTWFSERRWCSTTSPARHPTASPPSAWA